MKLAERMRKLTSLLGLRLPDGLEEAFREEYFRRSVKPVRISIIVAGTLYGLFGVLDRWIIPDALRMTLIIRYAVIAPLSALALLATFTRGFKRFMQPMLLFFSLTGGLGIIAMTVIARPPGSYFYYAGVIMVMMYAYTFSRLTFLNASLVSWLLLGLYNAATLTLTDSAFPVLLNNNFFLATANLLGMLGSYQMERYIRKDFLQSRMLLEKELLDRTIEQTASALRESEKKFRTLAETTTAGIFIHQGGKLLYANSVGETLFGYTREEFFTMDFSAIVHPDYRDLVRERGLARLRGAQAPSQYEFRIIRKDGTERWVYMTAGLIEYGGRPAIIGTLFDITDFKTAEAERARLYEENLRNCRIILEEEKRHLLEKEKILRDLHDGLGGIITNVKLLSELALNSAAPSGVRKMLATITELATEGLSEIRLFMRSLDGAETTWRTLLAGFRQLGSSLVGSRGITFSLSVELPEEMMDHPLGSMVYLNLHRIYKEAVTNVIKHAGAGALAARLALRSGAVTLAIEDDGPGIGNGTGRGMTNMKKRAEEIGGRLTITSGRGTLVALELPMPQKYPSRVMEQDPVTR